MSDSAETFGLDFDESLGTREVHEQGSIIMRQGDDGDCMYVLKSGTLEVLVGETKVAELEAVDMVGEMALIENKPRSATVKALTDCELVRVDRDQFAELAQKDLSFFQFVLRIMSGRVRAANIRNTQDK